MQGWSGCESLQEHQTIELTDSRDESTYTISKLKDGKCWMIQNLRLANKTISSENSDMKEGSFTIPASNINNFVTSEDDASAVYYDGNTSHGAYYDWYTATAGTGTKGVSVGDDALSSICPKGWHLPVGSEYKTLYSAYPSNGLMTDVPKFTAFGYVYNKAVQTNTYLYSYYLSTRVDYPEFGLGDSRVVGALYAYKSDSSSNASFSPESAYAYYGGSVRCVAGESNIKPYSIYYDLSGVAASSSPNPNPQTGMAETNVKIRGYAYQGGKAFRGWCTKPTNDQTCSGTSYDNSSEIPLDDSNRNITLYAMWEHYPNFSTFKCSSLSEGQYSSNYNYNNHTVSVRKANNKCWMDSMNRGSWQIISQATNNGCPTGWRWATQSDLQSIVNLYNPDNYCSKANSVIGNYNYVSSSTNYVCSTSATSASNYKTCTLSCWDSGGAHNGYGAKCVSS